MRAKAVRAEVVCGEIGPAGLTSRDCFGMQRHAYTARRRWTQRLRNLPLRLVRRRRPGSTLLVWPCGHSHLQRIGKFLRFGAVSETLFLSWTSLVFPRSLPPGWRRLRVPPPSRACTTRGPPQQNSALVSRPEWRGRGRRAGAGPAAEVIQCSRAVGEPAG
jgi:hypothetical protein